MKTIVLSVQPKWLEKILNGEKTVEIRKTIPKCGYPVRVLLYCTKGGEPLYTAQWQFVGRADQNGKIVGEFTLKTAYLVLNQGSSFYIHNDDKYIVNKIARESCLDFRDMQGYSKGKNVYAWVIDDLKVYDEPKTLSDYGLTKAPQSWCYIK